MKSSSLSAGKRLAYSFSTANGVPIYFDLSGFMPTLAFIRQRSHALQAAEDLAAAFSLTRDSSAAVNADMETLPGFRRKKRWAYCSPRHAEQLALAVVAFERALGIHLFDNQIIAGLVMCGGGLAELATGEGKTFAAALTAIVRGAEGQGCHVFTANDYLVERDAAWLAPVYSVLGLSCAALISDLDEAARRKAYQADITYLSAREAVYDYLRDGLVSSAENLRQRSLAAAIVDEADFLMIDQARAPLVIAAQSHAPAQLLRRYAFLAEKLRPGQHFTVDQRMRRITLTMEGQRAVSAVLQLEGMHRTEDLEPFARVHAALYARCLLVRDVDYVVRTARVELVDCFTGRVADGRRWPYGVQAAVETREQVPVQTETAILGSLTMQRFFPLYSKLAGMTATALPAAEEFVEVYGLSVHLISPRLPSCRLDAPDRLFLTLAEKETALLETAAAEHARGRPVLLVTASVAESEHIAALLHAQGIACQVLNAKFDRDEAELIARAGCRGAVTVATEMAGRGTDIRLGGPQPDPAELSWLAGLGGLCILVSGRRESRRHDDQLRGRAGRQGEPGSTCFYTSLEDPLFQRYGLCDFLSPQLRQQLEQARLQEEQPGLQLAPGLEHRSFMPVQDKRAQEEMDWAQRLIETHMHRLRSARRRSSQLLELQRRRISTWRSGLLQLGNGQSARLAAIDQFWQEHLALAEDLREGIHLARYGGRDPEREFDRRLDEAFLEGLAQLENTQEAELSRPVSDLAPGWPVAALGSDLTPGSPDAAPGSDPSSGWPVPVPGSDPTPGCPVSDSGSDPSSEWLVPVPGSDTTGFGAAASGGSGSTWTYQIDEDPLPAFTLPGLAGGTDLVQSVLQLPVLLFCWLLDRLSPKRKKR